MGRLNLATQTIPSTPSSGTADVFINSFDKQLYTYDDAAKLLMLNSGIVGITGNVTVTANATTVIVGGTPTAPIGANTIQANVSYRVTIIGSFTGTATATAFRIHLGTAGSASDAIILTASVTGGVGTSLAKCVIDMTFRTVGAAGTVSGYLTINQHAGAIVGVSAAASGQSVVVGTTTTAPNTTVNNYMTVSILSAAAGSSGTVSNATIERL